MAAPDAGIYVEFMAPDFRFLFALALLAVLAIAALRARVGGSASDKTNDRTASWRVTSLLVAVMAASFVPWLMTSGNGRYFLPWLLFVGPLCVALARQLPITRTARLALVALFVALQAFAIQQSAPWRAWTMSEWKNPPYFQVEVPPEARERPSTYVTMAPISYSLLAPLFHPESRWISLYYAPAPAANTPDARRTAALLAAAGSGRLLLLVPAVQGAMTQDRLPDANVSAALGGQLRRYGLVLDRAGTCRFLHSRSLAAMGLGEKTQEQREQSGFWLCGLERMEGGAPPAAPTTRHDAVFARLEAQCPRLFPSGGDHGSIALAHGEMRTYLSNEMKAYVYDNGEVFYKYYRALNPVLVGSIQDIMAGRAKLDCNRISGRSGLPWERGI